MDTLLGTYGKLFGRMRTSINLYELQNSSILNHVKSQYNSITLENEMKPDALLGSSPSLISVDEAKRLGYYIPSGYTETYVPKINFDKVDATLKICSENGIGVRAHTLV
nr:endo-1,4-beta-xylanase [Cellulosilyticum ruminicola]